MWSFWAKQTVAGNEMWRLAAFFATILSSLIIGRIARFVLERCAKRTRTRDREWVGIAMGALARPIVFLAFVLGLSLGITVLSLDASIQSALATLTNVLTITAVGCTVYCLVDVVDFYLQGLARKTASKVDDMLVPLVGKSLRVTVSIFIVLQVAQAVSDKPITSILATLGVGGLAVALAGQDTIKNFFGSFVIVGDKPFEIGDRVVIEGHDGYVETVGFRSTRIRTMDGNLVTLPNSEIVNKAVLNIGKRSYIRRVANIGLTYNTPPAKVERALAILKELLANHEGMHPDFPPWIFFNDFKDWSLNIQLIYWYHPCDNLKYLAFSERLNMEILTRFNEEGIEFAFPTQTMHVVADNPELLSLPVRS